MTLHWTKSKWSKKDLEFATVEFRIPIESGIASGIGQFYVSQNPQGLLAIEIVTDTPGNHWAERIQTRFQMSQLGADEIVEHPDPSVARYLLKGVD